MLLAVQIYSPVASNAICPGRPTAVAVAGTAPVPPAAPLMNVGIMQRIAAVIVVAATAWVVTKIGNIDMYIEAGISIVVFFDGKFDYEVALLNSSDIIYDSTIGYEDVRRFPSAEALIYEVIRLSTV